MNVILYTNILTPYRKRFYDLLFEEFQENGIDFKVLVMADTEPNRLWHYNEFETKYTRLLSCKTLTVGRAYIHINRNLKQEILNYNPDYIICAGSYLCPGIWKLQKWKNKLHYYCIYWSESHLGEQRNYSKIKLVIRELVRKYIYKRFDGYWYSGKLSRELIEKYAGISVTYEFVPNIVHQEKFAEATKKSEQDKIIIMEKYGISKNDFIFICPARLSKDKGIDLIIPLLGKCTFPRKITLLLVGDGELFEAIYDMSKLYNINVKLLGYQSEENIIDLYSISDALLLPSISDPNPLTCIEALWAGLPLLISNKVGNYPEVVEEGINGFVYSYDNYNDAIYIIEKMVSKSKFWREKASKRSLEIAREKYDSYKSVKRIVKSVRKIL